jgi:hypothetical protein
VSERHGTSGEGHERTHEHDHEPVSHEGPQPVVHVGQVHLVLAADAAPQPAEALVDRLRDFLGGLLSSLRDGGCTLIGHVKGAVDAGDVGQAYFSVTSFGGVPRIKGSLDGPIGRCLFTLNVIVFGIDQPSVEAAVRAAMNLHLTPWRAETNAPAAPRTLTGWRVEIGLDAALRGHGADPDELRRRRPGIAAVSDAAVREAQGLVRPLVICRELRIQAHGEAFLELDVGRFACGPWLARRLAGARALVAIVCTIGPELEDRASALFADDPAAALALDGAGTAAVEALATSVCEHFRQEADERGLRGSIPCWPGSPQWPAEEAQPQLFDLVDPERRQADKVRLLPSLLMRPGKSLSLLLGLTEEPVAQDQDCGVCAVRAVCRYRDRQAERGRQLRPDTATPRDMLRP